MNLFISKNCFYLYLFLFFITPTTVAAATPRLILTPTQFANLPDWSQDNHAQALIAFHHSCTEILTRPTAQTAFANFPEASDVKTWQRICKAAQQLTKPSQTQAQQFFEHWFTPYHITDQTNSQGLFTGYYLPLIKASLQKTKHYHVPIYALPTDLVKIDLGLFKPEWAQKKIVGQFTNNQTLQPYPDRIAINQGAIKNKARILLWGDNPIDVFFAQIQGSALVQLPDGKQMMIGYAGDNGRSYTAIGNILITQYGIDKKNMSMQTIRDWLQQHPTKIKTILNQDASYVFFKKLNHEAPLGTEQVPLTPERSLAIDINYLPFGAPLWLETTMPSSTKTFRHLMIAQDSGGAIRGVVRGDIYWGSGDAVAHIAGNMQNSGRYWILLPRAVDDSDR